MFAPSARTRALRAASAIQTHAGDDLGDVVEDPAEPRARRVEGLRLGLLARQAGGPGAIDRPHAERSGRRRQRAAGERGAARQRSAEARQPVAQLHEGLPARRGRARRSDAWPALALRGWLAVPAPVCEALARACAGRDRRRRGGARLRRGRGARRRGRRRGRGRCRRGRRGRRRGLCGAAGCLRCRGRGRAGGARPARRRGCRALRLELGVAPLRADAAAGATPAPPPSSSSSWPASRNDPSREPLEPQPRGGGRPRAGARRPGRGRGSGRDRSRGRLRCRLDLPRSVLLAVAGGVGGLRGQRGLPGLGRRRPRRRPASRRTRASSFRLSGHPRDPVGACRSEGIRAPGIAPANTAAARTRRPVPRRVGGQSNVDPVRFAGHPSVAAADRQGDEPRGTASSHREPEAGRSVRQHPHVLAAAALRAVDDELAGARAKRLSPPGSTRAADDERAQVDVARLERPPTTVGWVESATGSWAIQPPGPPRSRRAAATARRARRAGRATTPSPPAPSRGLTTSSSRRSSASARCSSRRGPTPARSAAAAPRRSRSARAARRRRTCACRRRRRSRTR